MQVAGARKVSVSSEAEALALFFEVCRPVKARWLAVVGVCESAS
jgi:hypothetical protein